MNKHGKNKISIIIPVYNEEENIEAIVSALINLDLPIVQILFIDDGSSDKTVEKIISFAESNDVIQYISFSKNFGHQIALKAGFDHVIGDCAITMDGDMQHPPQLIYDMYELWKSGADVVHTQRRDVEKQSFFKKNTSKLFYKVLNACSFVQIEPATADFRLLDRKIVLICRTLHEGTFFWRGLIPWLGFNQKYISYEPNLRLHGVSKYTLRKMCLLAWSGISSFSLLPLRFATILGMGLFCCSILYILYILACSMFGYAVPGWSSLMIAVLVIGSVQTIFLGIIGEYIGKLYMNEKRRPDYIIDKCKFSKNSMSD